MTDNPIVRYSPDGSVDEVIAHDCAMHLEVMGDGQWWIGLTVGGREWHINLGVTNARPVPYCRIEDAT